MRSYEKPLCNAETVVTYLLAAAQPESWLDQQVTLKGSNNEKQKELAKRFNHLDANYANYLESLKEPNNEKQKMQTLGDKNCVFECACIVIIVNLVLVLSFYLQYSLFHNFLTEL